MRAFRSIASAQCLYRPNDFSPFLESYFSKGLANDMRKQGMCGPKHVGSRNKNTEKLCARLQDEATQLGTIRYCKYGVSGRWLALGTISTIGQSPNPITVSPIANFLFRIFEQAEWWVSYNCVNRIGAPLG
jgi:hypothetical protein